MVEITASCSRGSQRVFVRAVVLEVREKKKNTYTDDLFFLLVSVRQREVVRCVLR